MFTNLSPQMINTANSNVALAIHVTSSDNVG